MKKGYLILIIAMLFYTYEFFLRIFPSTIVFELMQHFHRSAFAFSQLIASYYLSYSLMQIPAGLILDRYGTKWVLGLACLSCAVGSLIFASTSWFLLGVLARIIIGAGSAFAFIGALQLAYQWLPEKQFTTFSGIVIGFGTFIGTLTQSYATFLLNDLSWRTLFAIAAVVGGIIAVLIMVATPSSATKNISTLSVWPQLTLLLKNKMLFLNGIVGSFLYIPLSIFTGLWGISFLRLQYHLTLVQASTAISWNMIGWVVGGPLLGIVADRLTQYKGQLIVSGALLTAALFTLILFGQGFGFTATLLNRLLFFAGLTCSVQVVCWKIFQEIVPDAAVGIGLGLTNMIIMSGAVFLQPLVGYILEWLNPQAFFANSYHYTAQNLREALCLLPALLVVTGIAGYVMLRRETLK